MKVGRMQLLNFQYRFVHFNSSSSCYMLFFSRVFYIKEVSGNIPVAGPDDFIRGALPRPDKSETVMKQQTRMMKT